MNLRRRLPKEDLDISINLVSFIDVLLCLVIFFMVSTNFVNRSNIMLKLPKASTEATGAENKDKIEVTVNAQGQTYVNSVALANNSKESLQQALVESIKDQRADGLVINADGAATHQSVIDVLDAAKHVGLTRISFATDRTVTSADATHR